MHIRSNNSQHLLSPYFVPGTFLSVLRAHAQFNHPSEPGNSCFSYSNFTDKETEARRGSGACPSSYGQWVEGLTVSLIAAAGQRPDLEEISAVLSLPGVMSLQAQGKGVWGAHPHLAGWGLFLPWKCTMSLPPSWLSTSWSFCLEQWPLLLPSALSVSLLTCQA